MDDHKSYHDDPPTYEETMAGILPPPSNENTEQNQRRSSDSNASETSTARVGMHNHGYFKWVIFYESFDSENGSRIPCKDENEEKSN